MTRNTNELMATPVAELTGHGLGYNVLESLEEAGVTQLGHIKRMKEEDLINIRNIGQANATKIKNALRNYIRSIEMERLRPSGRLTAGNFRLMLQGKRVNIKAFNKTHNKMMDFNLVLAIGREELVEIFQEYLDEISSSGSEDEGRSTGEE